ncbi:MAG: family 43 glycosylhydrolase [Bacteroidales bacterium]|nr:family 43 glycosylhydrolase [Bacteroidales bacterium]
MKKLIILSILAGILFSHNSCTDIEGDGISTIVYNGSSVPEDSSYRNPVWNFDLTNASVFLSSGPFYAMGEEKEWAPGIRYVVPVLASTNLMNWSLIAQGEAFTEKPEWAEGDLSSVTAFFSKSLGMYYIFYKLGDEGLGAADARTPQGPYADYGKFTDSEELDVTEITDPFVYASGSTFYLFFGVPGEGIFGVRLSLIKNTLPTVSGTKFKIAGPDYSGSFVRKKGSIFYYYGTKNGEIVIGQADNIQGPYLDNTGTDLIQGPGTPLVMPTDEFQQLGQVAGIHSDYLDNDWILYTAVETTIPTLPTGDARYVLMLNQIHFNANGWPSLIIEARSGFCSPRFKN